MVAAVPKGGSTEHTSFFRAGDGKVLSPYLQDPSADPNPFGAIDIDIGTGHTIFRRLSKDYQIAELELHSGARVNRFEEKAAFNPMPDLYRLRHTRRCTKQIRSKEGRR